MSVREREHFRARAGVGEHRVLHGAPCLAAVARRALRRHPVGVRQQRHLACVLDGARDLALLLGVRRLWVLFPALLLVAFFVSLTGRSYWLAAHGVKDSAANCGCFGNLVQRSPAFGADLAATRQSPSKDNSRRSS